MMTWKSLSSASSLAVIVLGVNLVGCSSQTNFLQNIGLNVTQENQSSYINLSAKIDLGNALFDSLQIPVNDPRTGAAVGKVQLSTGSDGKSVVTLSVDASVALHADPSIGSVLPNGRPVPSALKAAQGELLAFPILNHSRVYIGGDMKTHVIAGVALAIQGLDGVMGKIGAPANLFFVKQMGSVNGVAGVYGSTEAHQNGIAVFAKYEIPQAEVMMLTQSNLSSSAVKVAPKSTAEITVNEGVNSNGQNRLYNYFYGKKRMLRPH